MDLNQLFDVEGSWNINSMKGAQERDRSRKTEMELMDLLSQVQARRGQESRANAKLPGELEGQGLQNIGQGIQNRQGNLNFGLDQRFRGREREATLQKTTADTEKATAESVRENGKAFIDDVAAIVSAKGSASPQDILSAANKNQMNREHILVQTMLQLDPMQLKKILPQMQGSSTAQRNKMAEVEAKNATDLEQSRIQAGATMGAARIGADSRATAAENRPQSIDQSIAQAIEKITELEMEKARQPDSRTSAMVQSQINMWKERLKQLQASVEGRATAPAREQAAQMQRIIQGAGGPGQPVAAPTPGQGNIVRWQDLTP